MNTNWDQIFLHSNKHAHFIARHLIKHFILNNFLLSSLLCIIVAVKIIYYACYT